jgi:hypothetical protein
LLLCASLTHLQVIKDIIVDNKLMTLVWTMLSIIPQHWQDLIFIKLIN